MFAPDSDKKHGKAFLPCSNCFGTKIKLQGLQLWYDMAQNLGAVIMRTTTEETKTYRIRNSWAQSQEFDNLMLCGYLHGLRNKRFLACPSRYSPIQLEQQTTQMTYRKLWREGRCKTRERERNKDREHSSTYNNLQLEPITFSKLRIYICVTILKKDGQCMRHIEAHLCNHCCSRKAMSITQPECVYL